MTDETEQESGMSPAEVQQRVEIWLAARQADAWFCDLRFNSQTLPPDPRQLARAQWREATAMHGADSPAAMGCLLALVRLAWGDETIVTSCRPGHEETPRWTTMCWGGTAMRNPLIYTWTTEREALVAALEAAPDQQRRPSVDSNKWLTIGPDGHALHVKPVIATAQDHVWEIGEGHPVAGAPIQVALGSAAPAPGETYSMVTIIGHTRTESGSYWVSDHGLKWCRWIADGIINAPCLSDNPPAPAEVIRGRWDMTPEVDAALAEHFKTSDPLTDEEIRG